jgi:putative glutamine amidotransferase
MRIALTLRVTEAQGYDELRDSISHDWLREAQSRNIQPLLIPNIRVSPEQYLKDLAPDLLILTGGGDAGEYEERDRTEDILFKYALEENLPVLGVCRGLQRMNQILGGALVPIEDHVCNNHQVTFMPEWHDIYGPHVSVNSYHNIAIDPHGVAPALRVAGTDTDGMIEAAYMPGKPVAGIMWHPERADAPEADWLLMLRLATGTPF